MNVKKLTVFIDLSVVLRSTRRHFSCLVRAQNAGEKKHGLKNRSLVYEFLKTFIYRGEKVFFYATK